MSTAPVTPKQRPEFVYDPTNERVVLAAAIAAEPEKRRALVRSIASDEMIVGDHSVMWRALRVLVDSGLAYEPEVFRRLVADEGVAVADEYIAGIEENASVPGNLEWHVANLRWDATKTRVFQTSLPELVRQMKDAKASHETVAAAARAVLRSLEGGSGRKYMHRKEELKREYNAEVQARASVGNFWATGYAAMDAHLVEGAMPQRTAIAVGLPGSGKSTWCVDFSIRLAKQERRVMYGAWEMPAKSMLDIFISSLTMIPLARVVQGALSGEELVRVRRVTEWVCDRITFMDNAFFSEELRRGKRSNDRTLDVLEGYIAEAACDVVIMDLWERCLVDLSYDGVTTALYRQQEIHKEYNVYGVLAHQLRLKDVERRTDKRPTRESIKGTGAFVEVADQIFGIHREGQFKDVDDDTIEVLCLKQRKGKAQWATAYKWRGEYAKVEGDGVDVSFDPSVETQTQYGTLDDVQTSKTRGRGGAVQRSRREG